MCIQHSIKEQILELERNKQIASDEVDFCNRIITGLRNTALYNCDHVFSVPLSGYEHEGGACFKCGLNQIYVACNRRK